MSSDTVQDELRQKLEDILENQFGIKESGYGVDELDDCIDDLAKLIAPEVAKGRIAILKDLNRFCKANGGQIWYFNIEDEIKRLESDLQSLAGQDDGQANE